MTAIIRLRSILPRLSRFEFDARAGEASQTGWTGHGEGTSDITEDGDSVRLFESGTFTLEGQPRSVPMRNVYRWDFHAERVALLHERRGPEAAVHLFDLVPDGNETLVNAQVHQCAADAYSARLMLTPAGFDLEWRIAGPRKDERITYRYRTA